MNGETTTKFPGVYSTAGVARVCRVSLKTVARWIDDGVLAGYRVPGGSHRRVGRAELVAFLAANGMPARWIDGA